MIRFDALIQQSIPVFARSYTSPLLRRVAAFRWTDSAHRSRKYFALFARLLILARRYATVARPRDFLSRENHSRVGGESAVLLALRSGFRKDGRVHGISTCEISFFFSSWKAILTGKVWRLGDNFIFPVTLARFLTLSFSKLGIDIIYLYFGEVCIFRFVLVIWNGDE